MKARYTVVNASRAAVEGLVEVDGEKVPYRRPALIVEMAPVDNEHAGTVKLCAFGKAVAEAVETFAEGAVIEASFARVDSVTEGNGGAGPATAAS